MRRSFHVTADRHVFWEQFFQVKGCSWTFGHTELRGQFTILRLWVGVAVWEAQNGNYFLSIKPHSPPKTTCTELTLQLVVKTSVTATVMKTLLIFTSYPDVTSMNLPKLDALLFLAVMWLMGTVFFSRKKTIPIWKNANVCGIFWAIMWWLRGHDATGEFFKCTYLVFQAK